MLRNIYVYLQKYVCALHFCGSHLNAPEQKVKFHLELEIRSVERGICTIAKFIMTELFL